MRFFFAMNDDTGALPPKSARSFRRRSVDDVSTGPHTRAADGAVADAFPLRDDPVHGVVGNLRADDDTVGEINLSHPIPVMTVAIDEPR